MWLPGVAFHSDTPPFEHLHFVVSPSDTGGRVVVANLTSLRKTGSDTTCVVQPHEHRWVNQPSVVAYRYSRMLPSSRLQSLYDEGRLRLDENLSASLLARVVAGFRDSPFVSEACRVEMEMHGLI